MSQHTPGPLEVDEATGGAVIRSESVGRGYYANIGIATQRDPHPVHGGGVSAVTAAANAKLWAAAPEMLEALRDAVRSCNCGGTGVVALPCPFCGDSTYDHECPDRATDCKASWCVKSRAAIALATGGAR